MTLFDALNHFMASHFVNAKQSCGGKFPQVSSQQELAGEED
jgi:hypothetical protein